jgi:hypothetical protein
MTESVQGLSIVIPCLNEEQSVGQVVDMALEGISRPGPSWPARPTWSSVTG